MAKLIVVEIAALEVEDFIERAAFPFVGPASQQRRPNHSSDKLLIVQVHGRGCSSMSSETKNGPLSLYRDCAGTGASRLLEFWLDTRQFGWGVMKVSSRQRKNRGGVYPKVAGLGAAG